jgi:hypothetical protein
MIELPNEAKTIPIAGAGIQSTKIRPPPNIKHAIVPRRNNIKPNAEDIARI